MAKKQIEIGKPIVTTFKKMSADYMTEDEFKRAVCEIAEEVCGGIWGPIDFSEGGKSLKTTPPQSYRDKTLRTREDIKEHIGSIYCKYTTQKSFPIMGVLVDYADAKNVCSNWPQYVKHPILAQVTIDAMHKMTVREIGCRVFTMNISTFGYPDLLGMLVVHKAKHKKIMASVPLLPKSDKELDALTAWKEDELAAEIGPTNEAFVEMWKMMRKQRIAKYLAAHEAKMAEVRAKLDALSREMVEFLEKIPVEPKYISPTNCADVPIFATLV